MTQKSWPVLKGETLADLIDWIKEVTRTRDDDIGDFDQLPDLYMRGRKVGKIPTDANDVSDEDRPGDFNYDDSYYYLLVQIDPTTVAWARWSLSAANPWPADFGDLAYLDKVTDAYVDSGAATDGQVLTADGAGGAAWETPQSGAIVQTVLARSTATTSTTATIPIDDTPPQITEGLEFISASITPTKATNRIRARFSGFFGGVNANNNATIALFQGGVSNALAAVFLKLEMTGNDTNQCILEHEFTAGTTSSMTLSIRGGKSSGTLQANTEVTTRLYGGVAGLILILEEIAV